MVALAHSLVIILFIALLIHPVVIAFLALIRQGYQQIELLRRRLKDIKYEKIRSHVSSEIKSKMLRLQMGSPSHAARRRFLILAVLHTSAINATPTHFAEALKYDVGERGAPAILAMGRGKLADDISELGSRYNIAKLQSPFLVRALMCTGDIRQETSLELSKPFVAHLALIVTKANGEDVVAPEIEIAENP